MVFFFFFLSQWPQVTLDLGRIFEWSPVVPHCGRGFTKVQRIKLIRLSEKQAVINGIFRQVYVVAFDSHVQRA